MLYPHSNHDMHTTTPTHTHIYRNTLSDQNTQAHISTHKPEHIQTSPLTYSDTHPHTPSCSIYSHVSITCPLPQVRILLPCLARSFGFHQFSSFFHSQLSSHPCVSRSYPISLLNSLFSSNSLIFQLPVSSVCSPSSTHTSSWSITIQPPFPAYASSP